MQFQHRRWRVRLADGAVRPAICTVTEVRRGIVHYQDEFGLSAAQYPSDFVSDVDRWLELVA
jgi:hypothetical protein